MVTFCLSAAVIAQTAPDAGTIQREIEDTRPQARPVEDFAGQEEGPPEVDAGDTLVTVAAFEFSGNTLIDSATLSDALVSYLERPLSLNDLDRATALVGDLYQDSGFLARVYLPRQEIVDGRVKIDIEEARFGTVRLDTDASERLAGSLADHYVSNLQPRGDFLRLRKLERALFLLDDLPGVSASGQFAPGVNLGESDLLLSLEDTAFFTGELSFDNQGSRGTGEERLALDLYLNSPLRLGDLLSANALYSEGNAFFRSAYSAPIGSSGLRMGVSGSWLAYEIVTDEFTELDIEGGAQTFGSNLQYPVIRTRDLNVYFNSNYESTYFENEANGATTSDYQSQVLSLGLTGNIFDSLFGGAANFASITVTFGDIDLGALDFSESADTDGQFSKMNFLLSRQQLLSSKLSAYAVVTGQFADSNLDSSEKFYLGGPPS